MKITKEYLRKIIKEALDEAGPIGTAQRKQLRRFSQASPSGGLPEPAGEEREMQGRWQVRELNTNTGVLDKTVRSAHRTNLLQKGFYVDHISPYGSSAYGPFDTFEEAKKFMVDAKRKMSAGVGKDIRSGSEEEYE